MLLWALQMLGVFRILAGVVMVVVALLRLVNDDWRAGLIWGSVAAFLLILGYIADAHGYMLFVADEYVGRADGVRQAVHRGLASGQVLNRHWTGLISWVQISGESVQVRWLHQRKPPCLAIIQPAGLPESTYSPLEAAERFSLWYPGSEVRVGWVAAAWAVYPGVQIRFIGKRLILALPSEGEARALAETLVVQTL